MYILSIFMSIFIKYFMYIYFSIYVHFIHICEYRDTDTKCVWGCKYIDLIKYLYNNKPIRDVYDDMSLVFFFIYYFAYFIVGMLKIIKF